MAPGVSDAWRPSAQMSVLRRRARLLAAARRFLDGRGVLEVTTPVMGRCGPVDVHLQLVEAVFPGDSRRFYLQPSPESAMKRLLAAGAGPIYQIGPAFRAGERGARHNPEFTLLEWYRPGFSLETLADELDALMACTLGLAPARRVCYREVFARHAGLDPFEASLAQLGEAARDVGLAASDDLVSWSEVGPVMRGRPRSWDERIGSGPPPVRVAEGWLHLYHGVATHFASGGGVYQAGAVLLDVDDPSRVLARTRRNILEPRTLYEVAGQVPNVVFPSGMVVRGVPADAVAPADARVQLYYGAADTSVGLATTTIGALCRACRED